MTSIRVAALAVSFSALYVANLRGQSAGRDLPLGFRSLAGVTLNRDSAATIRAKLGNAGERRVAVGHDRYLRWCFVPASRSSSTLVELMSNAGDMGTPGQELNVIRLRAEAPSKDREGCAQLRASADLSTPGGLRLGLAAANIEALLGRSTRRDADSLIYYFDAREFLRPGSPEYEAWNTPENREACFEAGPPYANVDASVIVLLRDGRAAEIRIERYDQSVC